MRTHLFALSGLLSLLAGGAALSEEERSMGVSPVSQERGSGMTLTWADNILTIQGERIPGKAVQILYLEAYCRPGSTDRDWNETVIGHKTELVSRSDDGRKLKLRCELKDGVVVEHVITARKDEVDFRLKAHNPTAKASQAHWVQPCMRVGEFTGTQQDADAYVYIKKCFIFVNGKPHRLPTPEWATQARYTPGQVWCPRHVPRDDVNPRPLSTLVPSNGLIGCYSADEKLILATAWEPYQELFQGVIRCIHNDFRVGGLAAGETKKIRGKIYIVPADMEGLVKRYEKDFPEQGK